MQLPHLAALTLLCLAAVGATLGFHCPTDCSCVQRSVRCVRKQLTAIPRFPQDTEMLDLRFNHLEEIPANAFVGLSRLTTLFLNDNEITLLDEGALNGLIGLRVLYLSSNHISRVPLRFFKQVPHLESIFLENNDIWQLDVNTFANLPQLNRIYIFNNKLSTIPAGTFSNLASLKRLRLDGNPIQCDCGIYSLWQHYQHHPQRHLITIALTCDTPNELYERSFTSLQEQNFHCKKPEILVSPRDMHATLDDIVELPCRMTGDPKPEISWLHGTQEISHAQSPHMELLPTGSLKINSVKVDDIGIYECIGRNAMGETKTQPIRLNIDFTPQPNPAAERNSELHFTHKPHDIIVSLHGGPVRLDCAASGTPQPEIQWFFNGRLVTQSTDTIRIQSNGSLVITEPTLRTAGTYRCEATNDMGSIHTNVRVEVRELPEILMSPQNQTIKVGKPLILECDADGNPIPTITWEFNGAPLVANGRVVLENENTELIVSAAKEANSGVYTCIAENENGKSMASATILIEPKTGPPQLLIGPYDLEAFAGTTIELPCKAEEMDGVQISWRRDGRLIDPNSFLNDKYEISGAGSLYVKNVTIIDGGRYECSLKNEHGRATGSALVTIRSSISSAPGDRYVRIAFSEAAKEIDLAINNTVDTLFSNRSRISTNGASAPPNYGELLRVFRFPNGEARQLARAAEIYERTLVNVRKHVLMGENLTVESEDYEFKDLLSRDHLRLVAELSGCMVPREMPNCTDMCYHSKYRSIGGTCNNLQQPAWGASLTAFRRVAQPVYENGFSMPIGWTKGKLYAGFPKPSSRLLSTTLISTKDITPDDAITHMVMQWGQFLDHDLDHAIPSVSSESWDGIDCKKTCELAPPCYPIEVPPNDPRIKNRRCIDVVRSSSICGSGMTSVFFDSVQNREQINQCTAYIDGSQVYGFDTELAQSLRNLTTDDGLLRVGIHFPNQKDTLPFTAPQDGMDCRRNLDENTMNCFVAGDIRVNEQVGLLAIHTIWMREHNRIAAKLREINRHWDGETIYQEARKIVGAQMQHITYKLWLPLIVGESGMRMLGEYRGYDPTVNPGIANEFATAALRFGHTLINPILHRLDSNFQPIQQGHLQLHKAFFAPWRIPYEGGVDPLMRGMFTTPAKLKKPDQNLNTELTEKLFLTAHAVALDLAAINIQRARDHGIPGYNVYRQFCNLSVAKTFDDLKNEISDAEVRGKLKKLYGHPDNIDIWVGGVLEDQLEGAKVGPLFQCLLVDQFRRVRDGDRFYYENPSVFLPEQLQQIKQSNFGRVLCDTGDNIQEITDNVFLLPKIQGGYKKCEDIPGINLYFWQDCGSCKSLPPLFDTYVPQTYVKSKRTKRSITDPNNEDPFLSELNFDKLYDINEERVSGLEEVVGSFQKEIKKLHKKMRKLEESCTRNPNDNEQEHKLKRNHCVDPNGTTRLNNEIWSPDPCTKCECRHAQVTCTHEKCADVICENGITPTKLPGACCSQCPQMANNRKN